MSASLKLKFTFNYQTHFHAFYKDRYLVFTIRFGIKGIFSTLSNTGTEEQPAGSIKSKSSCALCAAQVILLGGGGAGIDIAAMATLPAGQEALVLCLIYIYIHIYILHIDLTIRNNGYYFTKGYI